MVFLSFYEILDIIIIILALGFIFKDYLSLRSLYSYNIFTLNYSYGEGSSFKDFLFAASIVAPSVIFHEFGHKFIALSFGLEATFHAAYFWLLIGILLKLLNVGFIFFVPAYVAVLGNATPLESALIALAGPFVNLLLYFLSSLLLKSNLNLSFETKVALALSQRLNLLLFIFNLIPIPGFDGFNALISILRMF